MGIKGAGIATVAAWAVNVSLLCALIFTVKNNHRFGIFSNMRFDRDIFVRLMRFGIPASIQFTLDILAFTLFILLIGRIGNNELAATNIVIAINAMAFMPSMGVSQGVSVLVGQALGNRQPLLAAEYVRSSSVLLIGYILVIDILFLLAPDVVLAPFMVSSHNAAAQAAILDHGRTLLTIVAAYLFFDALYMVFSGALRGAGDTRFMMLATGVVAPLCLVLPVYLGIKYFQMGVVAAWIWVLVFITVLFLLATWRYLRGFWKDMLVIEDKAQG